LVSRKRISQAEQKMALSTKRQKEIAKAVTLLIPGAPYLFAEAIRELSAKRKFKTLPVSTSVWLATITHIRHEHTQYHGLLAGGYERGTARHFIVDEINDTLTQWRATRFLDASDDADMHATDE
jgi:hypothetical protein